MTIITFDGYLDKYGMVSCTKYPIFPAYPTENGLLFTAVAISSLPKTEENLIDFELLFNNCFIDGILYRSPEPHPKPDSFDNYLAVAFMSAYLNKPNMSKKLLWSLIKHFGIVRGEIFLRFPQVWLLLVVTAFPIFKWLFLPFCYILSSLQKPILPLYNTSGVQLQYVIINTLEIVYPQVGFFVRWYTSLLEKCSGLGEVFSIYYSPLHPIAKLWNK